MQTISWARFLNRGKKIKIFLITAWDTIEGKANRERVQELDGVYVCDRNVEEYGNIRMFSKIVRNLKQLSK